MPSVFTLSGPPEIKVGDCRWLKRLFDVGVAEGERGADYRAGACTAAGAWMDAKKKRCAWARGAKKKMTRAYALCHRQPRRWRRKDYL